MAKLAVFCLFTLSFQLAWASGGPTSGPCSDLESPTSTRSTQKKTRRPKERPPINEELADFVANYIRDIAPKVGSNIFWSHGLRNTFFAMIQRIKGPASPEEAALVRIPWLRSDGNNRNLSYLVRVRMLDGWRIIRDSLLPDRAGQPLELSDGALVESAFAEILKAEAIQPTPIPARRRGRHRRAIEEPARETVLHTSIATEISFDPEIASQFEKQLPELRSSFTGMIIAPSRYRPQSSTFLFAESKGYIAHVIWAQDPNSVIVTELQPFKDWHESIIETFWQRVAILQNLRDKNAILKTAIAIRPEWEEYVRIPASVLARVRYTRGIDLNEIEEWFRQYSLKSVVNLKEGKTEYTFSHRTIRRFLKLTTVDRAGVVTVLDVTYVQ